MRNILFALLGSSALLLSFTVRADVPPTAAAAGAPAIKTTSSEVSLVTQEEVVRRQAAQLQARALIEEGSKLVRDGKADAAIAKLEEALKILPRAKATEADYNRATHALSDAYSHEADRALKANDNPKASALAKKAIEYDAGNRTAEQIIVRSKGVEAEAARVEAHAAPDAAHTPEFIATKEQIKKLFREGKILLNSGQYDEAEKRFQQVLLLDPYSTDAHEMLQIVNDARHPSTLTGEEAARRRMLWLADSAWLLPTGGEVKRPELESSASRLQGTGLNQSLLQKLNEIKFPEIKFRDAALVDVVTYLSEQSRILDPKKEGVNIVLGPGLNAGSGAEAPAPPAAGAEAAAPAAAAAAAPAAAGSPVHPITIMLRNIPMIEALNLIAPLANLKYRLNVSAVVLLPIDAPTDVMITKSYPISASAFTKFIVAPEGGGGGGGGGGAAEKMTGAGATVTAVDVKTVFTGLVDFPAGSTIYFNDKVNMLIIKNTPENIEQFEKILPNFTGIAPQVEIEAKFIDISQGDLDELGFNWGVGQYNFGSFAASAAGSQANGLSSVTDGLRDSSAASGSAIASALGGGSGAAVNKLFALNGIMTDPQFQVVMKALSQKQSTDVLSAPKVTTENNVAAELKVVQEFIYPSEFASPSSGTPPTPAIPSGFKTKDVGVILQVTPQLQPDGYSIELKLAPSVVEFMGFIDYSPPPQNYTVANAGATGGTSGGATTGTLIYKIQQPLFSTRSVATSVVVFDGQTVVLGGLIKESSSKVDDKVPFLGDLPILGRLFQSKVTNRSKENLLIFVTARLIGPNGLPIHPDIARGGLR